MKFKHKDIEISLLDNGDFRAVVAKQVVLKKSLAAMKKHIDDVERNGFKEFSALAWTWNGPTLKEVKVVGVKKGAKYEGLLWCVDGNGTSKVVGENTPENIERIKSYLALKAERDKYNEKIDARIEMLFDKIVRVTCE